MCYIRPSHELCIYKRDSQRFHLRMRIHVNATETCWLAWWIEAMTRVVWDAGRRTTVEDARVAVRSQPGSEPIPVS